VGNRWERKAYVREWGNSDNFFCFPLLNGEELYVAGAAQKKDRKKKLGWIRGTSWE